MGGGWRREEERRRGEENGKSGVSVDDNPINRYKAEENIDIGDKKNFTFVYFMRTKLPIMEQTNLLDQR